MLVKGQFVNSDFASQAGAVGIRSIRSRARNRRYNGFIEMDVPSQPVKDSPNLVRAGLFSLDRLLSHIDPGTAQESEDFVNLIYDQRRMDLSSGNNGKTGR